MKNTVFYNLSILALILLLAACGNQNKKDSQKTIDEVETITAIGDELIFENDYVKVEKISLAPGQSQPIHEGENRLIYALTDYSIDWEEQGIKSGTKTWKKGDVHFHKAGKHSAANKGSATAEWLVFSKKNTDLPACGENTIENDVSYVSSDFAQTLLDNDFFKVTQVNLPVGESIPMHAGINRIIYSLSDYQILYESDKEEKNIKQFKKGDLHWHEACSHALENNGKTEAQFLVVSYK
jgi:hypothetical protein